MAEYLRLFALESKLALHLLVEVSATTIHDIMLDGLGLLEIGLREMVFNLARLRCRSDSGGRCFKLEIKSELGVLRRNLLFHKAIEFYLRGISKCFPEFKARSGSKQYYLQVEIFAGLLVGPVPFIQPSHTDRKVVTSRRK